jgi:hypothetical protein
MTSDQKVGSSSLSGCKSSLGAGRQAILTSQVDIAKTITCQSLATFGMNPSPLTQKNS